MKKEKPIPLTLDEFSARYIEPAAANLAASVGGAKTKEDALAQLRRLIEPKRKQGRAVK